MKYTIFRFQQDKLIDNGITVDEALVMNTVMDLYASEKFDSIIHEEEKYIWVKHQLLLDIIPIIGSKSKLKRILKKCVDDGYFKTVIKNSKNSMPGKYYYIKYTSKLTEITEYENIKGQNDTRTDVKMNLDQGSKWPNKDSSFSDSSLSHNNTSMAEVVEYYKSLSLPGFRTMTPARKKHINARINDYGIDEVKATLFKASKSKFLTSKDSKSWFTFDWIWNPNNFVKIVEGNYSKDETPTKPIKPKKVNLVFIDEEV